MLRTRVICLLTVMGCLLGLCVGVTALEVESGSTYCFQPGDFPQEEALTGICITGLPDPAAGTVMLGHRVLRAGDILTAEQLGQMTFAPLYSQKDSVAQVSYLPIYENRVAAMTTMEIAVLGKEDKAPVAEDSAIETYKNLSNQGKLKVVDPEGQTLTYTVTRQPKRGQVEVQEDGTFVYTPKKNKVGVDSFLYTATDPAGNVSREATVTVQILKPTDAAQYTDTVGSDCRFAAEWMKNTGLFVGEKIGDNLCFHENKAVTRGEFLSMMVGALKIPVEQTTTFTGYADNPPAWLKPYLAAALRAGLTNGLPSSETGIFGAQEYVTGAEVAVMMANAMDLPVATASMDSDDDMVWALPAIAAMGENGFELTAQEIMTRGQVAMLLYEVSCMAEDIPSLAMYQ